MAMAAAHSHTATGDMRQAVLGQPNSQHPWSEHPTSNIQRSTKFQVPTATNATWILNLGSSLDVGCWMLDFRSFVLPGVKCSPKPAVTEDYFNPPLLLCAAPKNPAPSLPNPRAAGGPGLRRT